MHRSGSLRMCSLKVSLDVQAYLQLSTTTSSPSLFDSLLCCPGMQTTGLAVLVGTRARGQPGATWMTTHTCPLHATMPSRCAVPSLVLSWCVCLCVMHMHGSWSSRSCSAYAEPNYPTATASLSVSFIIKRQRLSPSMAMHLMGLGLHAAALQSLVGRLSWAASSHVAGQVCALTPHLLFTCCLAA